MMELLLESGLRSLVLATSVGLLLAVLRVRDAAMRHTAWKLVLVGTVLMPLVVVAIPVIELPVLPGADPGMDVADESWTGAAGPLVPSAPASIESVWFSRRLREVLYAAVAMALIARIAVGYWTGVRLVRAASRADRTLVSRPRRRVRYRCSERFTVPMTFGTLFPVVLLPSEFGRWDPVKRQAVLDHEHAHVERQDFLTNLVASLARAVYWANPLVWWLEYRLAALAEQAADDVAAGQDRRRYSAFLLEIAESAEAGRIRAVAMARSGIHQRIDNLSKGRAMHLSRTRIIIMTTVIFLLFAGTSCVTATRAQTASSLAAQERATQADIEVELAGRERARQAALEAELEALERRQVEVEALERARQAAFEAEFEAGERNRQVVVEARERARLAALESELQLNARRIEARERALALQEQEVDRRQALDELELSNELRRAEESLVEIRRRVEEQRLEFQRALDRQGQAQDDIASLADRIRAAERAVERAREALRASEDRLRILMDQREAVEPEAESRSDN